MPRRTVLTDRQRSALLDLPIDEPSLRRHYTLDDDDLEYIGRRRRDENRLGFALQLCALRYPGRALQPGELIPSEVVAFIGTQLGIAVESLLPYAARRQTRQEHMMALRSIYGYRPFAGRTARDLRAWLDGQAEEARSNEELARRFVEECRLRQVILPAVSTLERLCADAAVAAERRVEERIADRLDPVTRMVLDGLLTETLEGRVTRFVWLRQPEPGNNAAAAGRLLERLEFLQSLGLSEQILEDLPAHRVARLRRQGERHFAEGLREMLDNRRLAILAVCVVEWQAGLADALVETHDRIVGRTWREAEKACDARIAEARTTVRRTLRSFADLGQALLEARHQPAMLEQAVSGKLGWDGLQDLVTVAERLTDTISNDPMAHVTQGHGRLRRYAPRMLRALDIQGAQVAKPLREAVGLIRDGHSHDNPRTFLRPASKWHRHLDAQPKGDKRLWEVAVLSHLRDGFRSGDIWLPRSRRHGDPTRALVPLPATTSDAALAVPLDAGVWLADRQAWMAYGLDRLAKAARAGAIPGGVIRDGGLNIDRLAADVPEEADELILDLYKRLPETRITDLLVEVDAEIGFTDAFVHLRTGAPCRDRIGLLNVLLAEGINLSLGKMADSTNTHDYWELMRLSRWHVEGDAFARALEMVIEAQARLPMATFWGPGTTASSDGQFFPTTRQGEAMNLVNARYGNEPGLKAYTHVSDRFGPFATQIIPATVNEAPYILDGLLMNETGRHVREQYADTGGFTDHVFAVTSILGYRFVPRIRDLPSKRIYLFDPAACPRELRGLIGGKLRQSLIASNWPDILRLGATLAAGTVAPSLILRKLAAYPRRNDLAAALREVGRIERTLFMIDWALDPAMQRRAQIGLNKGESHHALKNALRIGRQGEIRDRSTEGQHYRMAGLNLLAAIVIYWNTVRLGEAVASRRRAGLPVSPELLAHISPLGWAHLLINGEYRWRKRR